MVTLSLLYKIICKRQEKKIKIELMQSKIPASLKTLLKLYLIDNRILWQESNTVDLVF